MVPHYQRDASTSQMITPFIEPTQYIASIPPLLAASSYSGNPASPSQSTSEYMHTNVVLTPAQNQIQEQLQRKHEELQKVIVQQQEELRRVSEQLYITSFGMIPSIVNVSVPYTSNSDGRYMQSNYNQQQICSSTAPMHQLQLPQQSHGQIDSQSLNQDGSCSEMSYMQLQTPSHLIPASHSQHSLNSTSSQQLQGMQPVQHVQQVHMVNVMSQSDVESLPLQMGQEQAQNLFNSSGQSGRSPNIK